MFLLGRLAILDQTRGCGGIANSKPDAFAVPPADGMDSDIFHWALSLPPLQAVSASLTKVRSFDTIATKMNSTAPAAINAAKNRKYIGPTSV